MNATPPKTTDKRNGTCLKCGVSFDVSRAHRCVLSYAEFLAAKAITSPPTGITPVEPNEQLFDFQRDIVKWALRRGRAALFEDCGLGKTAQQLEWARQVSAQGRVLILCPLAVADQTVREGDKFGVEVHYHRRGENVDSAITITNYEMLDNFDPSQFAGVVLDESSILKHYEGKFRTQIIESFRNAPFRLACTATPAPNDYMELGNHAEFLGVMTRAEMLSMFFVHDGGDTSKWRLKGHAQKDFWRWVCSWAVMLRKPSDLGYSDDGFDLPPLRVKQLAVESSNNGDFLFPMEARTLQERIGARRSSISERAQACADLVNATRDQWVCWCALNAEADALEKLIPDAEQTRGSNTHEEKVATLRRFLSGELRVWITKGSMSGFGLNLQRCHNTAFVGISDSWEEYYQSVRRFWRFGQKQPVNAYIITSSAEGAVVANIKRKEADADRMALEMISNMHALNEENLKGIERKRDDYATDTAYGDGWVMHLGDCVESCRKMESESIDFSIFSPPFASLYTYSASERDMGNCRNYSQFASHFTFLVKELYRLIKPGRNVSFHCMNLPTTKTHHGHIGVQDFRGDLIRMFEREGFIFHSEVCIWKDPVTAMQRTKALGLLWKQLKKDSTMSRQGIPDYLVTMRKPGDNSAFVSHSEDAFPVLQWQQWASPVWMDINPSDTLQFRSAREDKDERHLCPLQLEVIRRAIVLWSNPGDTVLSPFAGIASEGFIALGGKTVTGAALDAPRKFVGCELKHSYYKQSVANLAMAIRERDEGNLLGWRNSPEDVEAPEPCACD